MENVLIVLFVIGCLTRLVRFARFGGRPKSRSREGRRVLVRVPAEDVPLHGAPRRLPHDPDPAVGIEE